MKKKFFTAAAAIVMAAGVLAGCKSSQLAADEIQDQNI